MVEMSVESFVEGFGYLDSIAWVGSNAWEWLSLVQGEDRDWSKCVSISRFQSVNCANLTATRLGFNDSNQT